MASLRTKEELFSIAAQVLDPEVPVINVVELGIVRDARETAPGTVKLTITPTYSGCPAMRVIEDELKAAFSTAGIPNIEIETIFSPPWTTDWMTAEAREKLRSYGIAPPHTKEQLVTLGSGKPRKADCPFCSSDNTELRSEFGATACKSFFFCRDCRQPFEHFKAI